MTKTIIIPMSEKTAEMGGAIPPHGTLVTGETLNPLFRENPAPTQIVKARKP